MKDVMQITFLNIDF